MPDGAVTRDSRRDAKIPGHAGQCGALAGFHRPVRPQGPPAGAALGPAGQYMPASGHAGQCIALAVAPF